MERDEMQKCEKCGVLMATCFADVLCGDCSADMLDNAMRDIDDKYPDVDMLSLPMRRR
jgi:hypothetical protein